MYTVVVLKSDVGIKKTCTGRGKTNKHTDTQSDIEDTRLDWLRGLFSEKVLEGEED